MWTIINNIAETRTYNLYRFLRFEIDGQYYLTYLEDLVEDVPPTTL